MKYATQLKAQQERKTAELKIYQPELDAFSKNIKASSALGQAETNVASRLSPPVARRPSTSKNGALAVAETTKAKDLKNCKLKPKYSFGPETKRSGLPGRCPDPYEHTLPFAISRS